MKTKRCLSCDQRIPEDSGDYCHECSDTPDGRPENIITGEIQTIQIKNLKSKSGEDLYSILTLLISTDFSVIYDYKNDIIYATKYLPRRL